MNKKLKFGDIITYKNGNKAIFVNKHNIVFECDCIGDGINWPYVDKVERYVRLKNFSSYDVWFTNQYRLEIIYEAKEILDEAEKRYLNNVIKPFKKDVTRIVKCDFQGEEFIKIYMLSSLDDFCLPSFKRGTMYKGMKLEKNYTLKMLGLED